MVEFQSVNKRVKVSETIKIFTRLCMAFIVGACLSCIVYYGYYGSSPAVGSHFTFNKGLTRQIFYS